MQKLNTLCTLYKYECEIVYNVFFIYGVGVDERFIGDS